MKLLLNAGAKFSAGVFFVAVLLFGPAGTLRYPNAWKFMALLFLPMLVLGVVLFWKAPALLEKRLNNRERESGQKGVVALAALPLTQELTLLKKRGVSACRKALILLTCGCFLYQGIYSLYFIRVDKTAMDRWDGMEYYAMDTMDQVRDCAAFMQENGYTHGFINYWYASPMIELSNGALNVAGIQNAESSERIELCRWGSSKSAFEPENMPEKVMVFIEREQAPAFESLFPALPLVHEGWIFNGYEADSSLIQ